MRASPKTPDGRFRGPVLAVRSIRSRYGDAESLRRPQVARAECDRAGSPVARAYIGDAGRGKADRSMSAIVCYTLPRGCYQLLALSHQHSAALLTAPRP